MPSWRYCACQGQPGGPVAGGSGGDMVDLIDLPRFGSPNGRFGAGEQDWLPVELDLDYIRTGVPTTFEARWRTIPARWNDTGL